MTTYTIDLNGKRYELNDNFREGIEQRARGAYRKNPQFSCWWKSEDGDPILVIETTGPMVPWDRLDEVELRMAPHEMHPPESDEPDEEGEELDAGNGMKVVEPPEPDEPDPTHDDHSDYFGRTHFSVTPGEFREVPDPGGQDPEGIPPAPESFDEPSLVMWVPKHPDIEHRWTTGEAITVFNSWVEWNIQKRADQPDPLKDKANTHDRFESLCRINDCDVVAEAEPSNDIPREVSGEVERKGEEAFEDGRYGGNNWSM